MNVSLRRGPRAALVLADGTAFLGQGLGATGAVVGELVFNTAMTGYQEILTDPSYAGQLITFTFPHIGNVGTNDEDIEAINCHARGVVLRAPITQPSNFRAAQHLDRWLEARAGRDRRGRHQTHHPASPGYRRPGGRLGVRARPGSGSGTSGRDGPRVAGDGRHGPRIRGLLPSALRMGRDSLALSAGIRSPRTRPAPCGRRRLRNQAQHPALARQPRHATYGGPGDHPGGGCPGAGAGWRFSVQRPGRSRGHRGFAVPQIQKLLASGKPLFGICLGHQMLALALGATTEKMKFGHHGANHPVQDLTTGKVEITSQNHGFAVRPDSLPASVELTSCVAVRRVAGRASACGIGPCSRCSITPRPRPVRRTAPTCSSASCD